MRPLGEAARLEHRRRVLEPVALEQAELDALRDGAEGAHDVLRRQVVGVALARRGDGLDEPRERSCRRLTPWSHESAALSSLGSRQRMKWSSPDWSVAMSDLSDALNPSTTPTNLPERILLAAPPPRARSFECVEPDAAPASASIAAAASLSSCSASLAACIIDATKASSENSTSTCRSCETGSLFFSRNRATLYVTSPAKWRIANSSADVLSSAYEACSRKALLAFCR